MFKNLIIFAVNGDMPNSAAALAEKLAERTFTPCGPTQPASRGWVPPRGIAHGALIESFEGRHWLLKLQTETKLLPTEVVQRRVDAMAAEVERQTGRKPGKRQRREMKEQATLELLPVAFTRRAEVPVWIDRVARLVMVATSSTTKSDIAITELVSAWPEMNLHGLTVKRYVDACMATWLSDGYPPDDFVVDREAVLENAESHAVVRYQHTTLDTPDVRDHVRSGKVPTKLALTYGGRISFVLVDDLRLQRIVIGDGEIMQQRKPGADEFDADAIIAMLELSALIDALITEFGGIDVTPVEEAAAAGAADSSVRAAAKALEDSARENGHTIEVSTSDGETLITFGTGDDPMYPDARDAVVREGKASISLVQRHLRIGYARAARLLEAMETAGVVSAMDTTGTRRVLVQA